MHPSVARNSTVTEPLRAGSLATATWVGLGFALLGPLLVYGAVRVFFGPDETAARVMLGLAVHWLNLAAVVLIVVAWEQRSAASVGLRPLRWSTIPLGVLSGLAVFLCTPLIAGLNRALGLTSDASLAAFLMSLPFGLRAAVVVTAGIFEEVLYRGYAVERLIEWTGSRTLAGAVTVAAFALAHVPAVGLAHLLPVFVVSVLVTLLYLWKRDLMVNIIAHTVIDGIALLALPALAHFGGH